MKRVKELSALEVGRLSKPGRYAVGGIPGLLLQIQSEQARSWILRVMVGAKRRDIGLGAFPAVTLAGARDAARAIRQKITEGIDPVAEKAAIKSRLAAEVASAITFKEAAERFVAANEAGWKNAKHSAQWVSTLERYAYPVIGAVHVASVETAHVFQILEPIWKEKTETASRLRGRIEKVLDWAKVRGFREGENPARWKGHLAGILPAASKVQRTENHPALPFRRIAEFMSALRLVEGIGSLALQFQILTACRSGEVRGARWAEIDLAEKTWRIPASRMKAGREHLIPLSASALAILERLPKTGELVFPSPSRGVKLSDMSLTAIIRRMNTAAEKAGGKLWLDEVQNKPVVPHGFRSAFRDWAGEVSNHARETVEHALAHGIPGKTEAAYARGSHFSKRRKLMQDWAHVCEHGLPSTADNVVPLKASGK